MEREPDPPGSEDRSSCPPSELQRAQAIQDFGDMPFRRLRRSLFYAIILVASLINVAFIGYHYALYGSHFFTPWTEEFYELVLLMGLFPVFAILGYLFYRKDALEAKLTSSHTELMKAYDECQVASRLRDEFISNVSHELRTPLVVAIGAMDLAKERVEEKERGELLEMCEASLFDLNRLIDNLLDLSRLESGAYTFKLVGLEIEPMVQAVLESFRPLAEGKKVKLRGRLEAGLPKVPASEEGIRSIMGNLLANAIKFNREGGEVLVEAARQGEEIVISVSDTGIGIPKEHLGRIFEKFYQVDGDLRRKYPGTGIGLALVKKYVELMGGTIKVESEVGKGSRFTFTLPLRQG